MTDINKQPSMTSVLVYGLISEIKRKGDTKNKIDEIAERYIALFDEWRVRENERSETRYEVYKEENGMMHGWYDASIIEYEKHTGSKRIVVNNERTNYYDWDKAFEEARKYATAEAKKNEFTEHWLSDFEWFLQNNYFLTKGVMESKEPFKDYTIENIWDAAYERGLWELQPCDTDSIPLTKQVFFKKLK